MDELWDKIAADTEKIPIYGKNAVVAMLKSGAAVDTVLLADSLAEPAARYLTALSKEAGAVVKRTRAVRLTSLCKSEAHQGVVLFAAEVIYRSLDELLDAAQSRGEPPFLLLCDGIEDPHNLGALLRSALLCGVHGAVIPKRGSAAVTGAVMKASAGAAALLPVARVANLGEAVRRLKQKGVFVYCAEMNGAILAPRDLGGSVALVLGAESRGVSPLIKKLCDGAIRLEMRSAPGAPDSFNVSVAGGIIMYDIFRCRL